MTSLPSPLQTQWNERNPLFCFCNAILFPVILIQISLKRGKYINVVNLKDKSLAYPRITLWLFYFFSICTFTIQYIKLCASAGMSLSSVSGALNIILDSLSSFILVFDRKKAGGLLNKWWKKMFNLVHSRIILYFQWFIFYPPWAFSKDWGGLTLTGERMWPRRHFDTSNIQNFSHSYGVNVKAKTKLEKVSGQIYSFPFQCF